MPRRPSSGSTASIRAAAAAYLRLSGASGGKLTVARFIPIEMAAEEESCPEGTEKLSVLIRNNTGDEASFDAVFALEAYLKDKWTAVPFDGAFDDWAGVLPAGSPKPPARWTSPRWGRRSSRRGTASSSSCAAATAACGCPRPSRSPSPPTGWRLKNRWRSAS